MKGIYGDKRKQCLLLEVGIGWEHSQENSVRLLCSTSLFTAILPLNLSQNHLLLMICTVPTLDHISTVSDVQVSRTLCLRNERKDKSPRGSSDTTVVLLYVNEPLPQNFHSLLIQNINFLLCLSWFSQYFQALTMGKDIVSMGKCIPIFNNLLKLLNFTEPSISSLATFHLLFS